MANTTFESMISDILPLMPECTDNLIIRSLRRASEEFLTKSLVWRVDLDPHVTVAGLAVIELDLPKSDLRVAQLKALSIDKKKVEQASDDTTGTGTFCTLIDFGKSVRITPTPKSTLPVVIRAVLTTTPTSTGLESSVANFIYEHLIDGALARLYAMPGTPWSDNTLAGFHLGAFNAAITQSRGAAENNSGRAVRKIAYGGN